MTKKTIILVLIFLIVINTIFWLYIGIRVYRLISLKKSFKEWSSGELIKYMSDESRTKYIQNEVHLQGKLTLGFGGYFVRTFEDTYPHTPFIILAITNSVLVAISFMVILLYKKE